MVKRPLIWVLAAFVVGCLCSKYKIFSFMQAVFILLVLSLLILFLNLQYKFFFCMLPIVVLISYSFTKYELRDQALDMFILNQSTVKVRGIVSHITEKEAVNSAILEDVLVEKNFYLDPKASEEEKIYFNSKVSEEKICVISKLLVYFPKEVCLLVGNEIETEGELKTFQSPSNPGQFDEKLYYQSKHISYKMYVDVILVKNAEYSKFHKLLATIKNSFLNLYSLSLQPEEEGIMAAMITGDKSYLEGEIKELYQKNGIAHILAISGLHISIIGMCFYHFLQKIGLHNTISSFLTMGMVFCYGIMTDFSISTNRAFVMLVVMLSAKVIGRTYDMKSAAAFSCLLILIQSPLQLFQGGFLLSFGAIGAIAYLYPEFLNCFGSIQENTHHKNSFLSTMRKGLQQSFFLSLSIQMITLPIILFFYYEFPLYGLFLNLIVLPLVSLLVLLGVLGGIVGSFLLPVGIFLMGGVHFILSFYQWLCEIFLKLPGNVQIVGKPKIWQIAAYYSIILFFLWKGKKGLEEIGRFSYAWSKWKWMLLIGCFVLFLPHTFEGLEITCLDVGQGDGIFLRYGDENMLIDGGSTDVKKLGQYRLIPFLKSKGIKQITYAIMTHADKDHISGLKELLEQNGTDLIIENLILPKTNVRDSAYLSIEKMGLEKGIKVWYIQKGDEITIGKKKKSVSVHCLHPSKDYNAPSRNAYSTVLSVKYGDFSMLLTGDLEEDGENRLLSLSNGELLEYDILKVAHHGSKFSTSEVFLQKVSPKISIISCGEENSYGHPHKELLSRLEERKSKIFITKDSGAIIIYTDGEKVSIEKYKKESDALSLK